MTNRWLVSLPVWGTSYFRTFERVCAPALLAACEDLKEPVRCLVYTDQDPKRVQAALKHLPVDVRPVPSKPTYVTLQESHADTLRCAAPGDRVVFLNADLTISRNLLARCAEHFAEGRQAVVLLGIRTVAGDEPPPAGASPRTLLSWAWDHRHQIIKDLEWGTGRSLLTTNLFWSVGTSVVARGFHLHPVAVVKSADVQFQSTIDGDLLDHFPREKIHVVIDPDDCALCEVSPPERRFPCSNQPLSPARVSGSMRTRASDTHKWLFTHRIGVVGASDDVVEDYSVAAAIFTHMRFVVDESGTGPVPAGPRGLMPAGKVGRYPAGHPRRPRRV